MGIVKRFIKLRLMMHVFNRSTLEAQAGGLL